MPLKYSKRVLTNTTLPSWQTSIRKPQIIHPLATCAPLHTSGGGKCVTENSGIWGPHRWPRPYQVCTLTPNQHHYVAFSLSTALLIAPRSGTGINHQLLSHRSSPASHTRSPTTQRTLGLGRASGSWRAPHRLLHYNRRSKLWANWGWSGAEPNNK